TGFGTARDTYKVGVQTKDDDKSIRRLLPRLCTNERVVLRLFKPRVGEPDAGGVSTAVVLCCRPRVRSTIALSQPQASVIARVRAFVVISIDRALLNRLTNEQGAGQSQCVHVRVRICCCCRFLSTKK
ncbi:unnamed protein product, partial [Ectocarpus sp. 4 AP-2014]